MAESKQETPFDVRLCDLGSAMFESVSIEFATPGWYCTTCDCRQESGGPQNAPVPTGVCGREYLTVNPKRLAYCYRAEYGRDLPKDQPIEDIIEDLEDEYEFYDDETCAGTQYEWRNPVTDIEKHDANFMDFRAQIAQTANMDLDA